MQLQERNGANTPTRCTPRKDRVQGQHWLRKVQFLWSYVLVSIVGLALHVPATADSVPFWGARASVAVETPLDRLKHGEFLWLGDTVTSGPLVMVVSITAQQGYVYRNGVLIGATSVSTGRPGHRTPTGVFTVLQKQQEHRSTIYDGAPMPYMERLTWGGIALHAGGLPGYPESHGCIHLPSEFAKSLFAISSIGMTVVITDDASGPQRVSRPGFLAPVSVTGEPEEGVALAPTVEESWHPELSPTGPVSIVLSQASAHAVVYRNGIEIGRARLSISDAAPLVTHAYVLAEGPSGVPDPYVPDSAKYRWLRLEVPGHPGEAGVQVDPAQLARIHLPDSFVTHVNSILATGATVLVTSAPLSQQTTGASAQLIDADPPKAGHSRDQ
jgi:hypothetical protein